MNKLHVLLPIFLMLILPDSAFSQPPREQTNVGLRDIVRDNSPAIEESAFQLLMTIARLRPDLVTDPDSPLFFEILDADPQAFGLTTADIREMRDNPFALRRSQKELLEEIQRKASSASINYFVTESSRSGRDSLGDYDFERNRFTKSNGTESYFSLQPIWNRRDRNVPFESFVSPAAVSISELSMSQTRAESLMDWMGPARGEYLARLTTRWEYRIQRVESGTNGSDLIAHIRPLRLRIDAERRKRAESRSQWGSAGTVEILNMDLTETMVTSEVRERQLLRELRLSESDDGNLDLLGISTGMHTNDAVTALNRHFQGRAPKIGVMTPDIWSRINRNPSFLSDSTAFQVRTNEGMNETVAIYADPADQASVFYVMQWLQFPSRIGESERADLIGGMIRQWGSDFIQNSDSWIWSRDPAAIGRAAAGLQGSGIHCLEEIDLTRASAGRWYTPESNNRSAPPDIAFVAPALQSRRGGADARIRSACPPLIHVRIRAREIQVQLYDAELALEVKRRFDDSVRRQNQNSTAERIQNFGL